MVAALRFNGRLPGVLCDPTPLPLAETPLRLDVAGFIGFAERGPIDVPIAVEDVNQYRAIFGGELAVAVDDGTPVYAHLPSAVRAFFDNGGRRCHVVRVTGNTAGSPAANRFRVPGLFAWWPTRGFEPVEVEAAWAGRWSNDVRVGTQLYRIPLKPTAFRRFDDGNRPVRIECDLLTPPNLAIVAGDVIRLRFQAGRGLLFSVAATSPPATNNGQVTTVTATAAFGIDADATTPLPATIQRLDPAGWTTVAQLLTPIVTLPHGRGYEFDVAGISTRAGDLLRIVFAGPGAGRTVILRAEEVSRGARCMVTVRASEVVSSLPGLLPTEGMGNLVSAELFRFDLLVREARDLDDVDARAETWSDLRFGTQPLGPVTRGPVPRSWIDVLAPVAITAAEREIDTSRSMLLRALSISPDDGEPFGFFPLGMDDLGRRERFAAPLRMPASNCEPVARQNEPDLDGLATFNAEEMFLDPGLGGVGGGALLGEAEYLRSLGPNPRPLRKLHSLLPIDEIGLIALPDLVQPGWPGPAQPIRPVLPEPEPDPVDLACFRDCQSPLKEPTLEAIPCKQCDASIAVDDLEPLDVRADLSDLPSPRPASEVDIEALIKVQTALVELCAARGDVLAVLSLPVHFGPHESTDWRQRLLANFADADGRGLSFAAVYHPWPQLREERTPQLAPLRFMPPDGAATGLIAAHELARGVWIAPANLSPRGVVGLTPELTETDLEDLFDQQVNLLRLQAGQIATLSAHTLSPDRQLFQISVRRLMILLRKLALRRGERYVFETNNERFRQRVQSSFERTLGILQARGAITAFEAVTDASINTQNDIDNGRFLIALKVAPSSPIEFITVILSRAGEDLLDVLER